MNIGDLVTRNSYNNDLLFRVTHIEGKYCLLAGVNYRLQVSAEKNDLQPVKLEQLKYFKREFVDETTDKIKRILQEREKKLDGRKVQVKPGKVLHIDADREYLKLCMTYYEKLDVPVAGENITESMQADSLVLLLRKHMPDILVLTGHDSLKNSKEKNTVDSYKSSGFFVEAVKSARIFNPSKDSLVIISGACQSYFEALIDAGANIASSPKRILIHALDPLFAAEKISYTPMDKILNVEEILENTVTGIDGLGGYQTRGTLREGIHFS